MNEIVFLSVLSSVNPGDPFERAIQGDLPGGLVVVSFLLVLIAGWSIQGGLAQRRIG